jgi:DnaJ-class molecular chaperone
LQRAEINHYATLGLDRSCTLAQIRTAYRLLAKQHHPDLNPGSPAAVATTQKLNSACEIPSDPARRLAYDRELDAVKKSAPPLRAGKLQRVIFRDVNLRIEEFLRGTEREVRIHDPANPHGPESYQFVVPPETAPGTRFRLPRNGPGAEGFVQLRVRALPGFRFKVHRSDLRCDLRIKPERVAQGGVEMIPGATGAMIRVQIPRGVARGQILRLPSEGLPKPRGGRGDLLVRINYHIKVRIARQSP